MTSAIDQAASTADIQLEVHIDAPRERVWQALTQDIGAWWHKDFFMGANATFHCDPKLGGWMYEDWGDGEGLIWGTITGIRSPELLITAGDTSAEWGGPNRGIMSWNLAASDDGASTTVRFRHALHGRVSEQTRQSLEGGWKLLIADCMKPYAESGQRPAASDADAGPCES